VARKASFIKFGKNFYVNIRYANALKRAGIKSLDSVFELQKGQHLEKENLKPHRSRIKLDVPDLGPVYIKRYKNPPVMTQIKNWFDRRKIVPSCKQDLLPAAELTAMAINTPETIAYGWENNGPIEKRSFIISAQVPGESLEKKLPEYFQSPQGKTNVGLREEFIDKLARFIRKFHRTGYRHRDLYLSHIFYDNREFILIDLHRCFTPLLLKWRYRIKDIAQLYYSAPGHIFTETDRLRFYRSYAKVKKLGKFDKLFIKLVRAKAWQMAKRDIRKGRNVPFASCPEDSYKEPEN
jgi:heptose I phosphotransferase